MILRQLVVQREDLRLLFRVTAGQPFGGCSCLAVQLPPPPEGEALVRDVAHDRLPEAPSLALGLEETAELRSHLHRCDAVGHIVGQDDAEDLDAEAPSEHGRTAQEPPMTGFQRVDLPADHRVERLGQVCVEPFLPNDPQRLLQEERVAGGSADDRLHDVRPHRCRVGHRPDEVLGLLPGQRLDEQRVRAGRSEAALPWPPEREHEPSSRGGRDGHVPEQLGGRLINPLGVFDDDHERTRESLLDEPEQRRREAIAPEAGLDLVDLRVDGTATWATSPRSGRWVRSSGAMSVTPRRSCAAMRSGASRSTPTRVRTGSRSAR